MIVNGELSINKYRKVVNEGNLVLAKGAARPKEGRSILRPNKYDSSRANLACFNWTKKPAMEVDAGSFLKKGDGYRLMNPRDFFGKPVLAWNYDGKALHVPMTGEFAAFVLLKESR